MLGQTHVPLNEDFRFRCAHRHPYVIVGPTVVAALIWPTYNVPCNAIRDTCVLSVSEKLLTRCNGPLIYEPVGSEKQTEKQSHVSKHSVNDFYTEWCTRTRLALTNANYPIKQSTNQEIHHPTRQRTTWNVKRTAPEQRPNILKKPTRRKLTNQPKKTSNENTISLPTYSSNQPTNQLSKNQQTQKSTVINQSIKRIRKQINAQWTMKGKRGQWNKETTQQRNDQPG